MKKTYLSSDIGMRTDAQIDRRQVYCPNSESLGFSRKIARKGYIVIWNDNGQRRICRMAGRIKYAAECGSKENQTYTPTLRNWLMLVVLNQSASSYYIRWAPPEEIEEIYSPTDYLQKMRAKIERFLSDDFMKQNPFEIAQEVYRG